MFAFCMYLISRHQSVLVTYFLQFESLEMTEMAQIVYFCRNLGNCFQKLWAIVGLQKSKKLFIKRQATKNVLYMLSLFLKELYTM